MLKIFPATLIQDPGGKAPRKVPLIKGWKEKATNDPAQIEAWTKEFGQRIKFWAVPTGSINNILALDVDVKGGGLETVKKYLVPQTLSQKTMSGGQHHIFKMPNDGRQYGNRVGFDAGLDIRGEGGYIAYYGMNNLPPCEAPDWFLSQCIAVEATEVDYESAVKVDAEIAQSMLAESLENIRNAPDGESNNVLNIESFKVGQLVSTQSLDKDLAYEELFKAAKDRGKPDYEAKATIESGLFGGIAKPMVSPFSSEKPTPLFTIVEPEAPSRWTPEFFTKYDLMNISNLRKPQLFKDWSTQDIHITTADGGTGKTTLKLCEAISLALGERFLGFECVKEGRTLFITGEDTREKLGAMLGAIMKQMGLFDKTPENNAKVRKIMNAIVVKKDADLCLIAKDSQHFLTPNSDAMVKLTEAIEDIRPSMIVFDPISSFWGSESALNDMAKAVSKFMATLVEKSGACVEIINHMGKASSKDKDMSQFAGRGGSGLPSHARVSRVLRPIFEEEYTELTGMELKEGQSCIMCNVNKFSDGSPLYNKPFLILREGYLFTRQTLTEQKVKEQNDKKSDVERIFTFIKQERDSGRFPTKDIVIGYMTNQVDKVSKSRVGLALSSLAYTGHMGEKIKKIESPDPEMKESVYIIVNEKGEEL